MTHANPSSVRTNRRWPAGGAVAALLVSSVFGCQNVKNANPRPSKTTATSTGLSRPDVPLPKTDFHGEVRAEQKFNVHMEMARVYESQGRLEPALGEYEKALAASRPPGTGLIRRAGDVAGRALAERKLAALYDKMGRFAKAEAHYKSAQKLAPGDARVWNDVGYSQYLQQHWAEAENALKTADRLEPNNPRTLTNLGLTYAAQGKTDEALAVLTRAGGRAAAHANVGYVLAGLGLRDEAAEQYRKAILVQPELVPARQALVALRHPPAQPGPGIAADPIPLPNADRPRTALAADPRPAEHPKDAGVLRAATPWPPLPGPDGIPLPVLPPPPRPATPAS